MKRVVITGLGTIAPNGNNFETSWQNTLKGISGINSIKSFDASHLDVKIAGEIKDLNSSSFFTPKELKIYSRFVQLAILTTNEALENAQLKVKDQPESTIGCIIGVGIGDIETIQQTSLTLRDKGPKKVSPYFIPYVIANMAAGNTANYFNLKGPNSCITTACASGTHAIGEAWLQIKNNQADVIVCGGSEAALSELTVVGFSRMKALSCNNENPQKASRPFDKNRDGFVLSEGAGLLVLEDYEHAKKRGAPIYAEMVGYGQSCDAYHITSPSPNGEGASRCIQNALKSAQVNYNEISYINAHGSSTYYNDLYETQAIKTIFKEHSKNLLVSSTKGATGHCLGATGGIEAAFLARALKDGIFPPTANLEEPGETLDLDYIPQKAVEKNISYGISNSFGFGGTNACIVLKKHS